MHLLRLLSLFFVVDVLCAAAPRPEWAAAEASYDALLRERVAAGRVDYTALKTDPRLGAFLDAAARIDPAALASREAALAYWLNLYNAATLKLAADRYPIASIHDLAKGGRYLSFALGTTPWDIRFVDTTRGRLTLNEIEHEIVRRDFADEPRIHFALVCAALSCPPLRSEAYAAERLDAQLAEQTRAFLADERHNTFDPAKRVARVSAIFDWYGKDFGEGDRAVLAWIARWAPPAVAEALAADPGRWRLRFAAYDWALNDAASASPARKN
jgi:hypothetical protein